jgi:hypothetical protein
MLILLFTMASNIRSRCKVAAVPIVFGLPYYVPAFLLFYGLDEIGRLPAVAKRRSHQPVLVSADSDNPNVS